MSAPTTHITTCLLPLLLAFILTSVHMLTANAKSMTAVGQHRIRHQNQRVVDIDQMILEDIMIGRTNISSRRSRRRSVLQADENIKRSVEGSYFGTKNKRSFTTTDTQLTIFITPQGFRGINAKSSMASSLYISGRVN